MDLSILVPFILPVIMIVLSVVVSALCLVFTFNLIKRQIKLYNSITLVKLRCVKFHYYIFISIVTAFIIYLILQMSNPLSGEIALLSNFLGMELWQSGLTFAFLLFMLVCVEFLLIVIAYSKSAVVDKGVYTLLTYLDWYNLHDYLIDEEKCIVVLSSEKDTFSTIKGTTQPLKVAKNDISKLKFILNKNKNKFSGFKDAALEK